MRLRVDFETAGIILTLPQGATEEHGFRFVLSQTEWILDRLARFAAPGDDAGSTPLGQADEGIGFT